MTNACRIAAWNRLGTSIHSQAYIGPGVDIKFGTDVSIGTGSALSGAVELAAWGSITIGDNVMISGGTHLLTGTHDVRDPGFRGVVRPITIGDNCWLAQGAVVLPGVDLAEGAVVGAYAVVSKNVASRSIVVGNPARHTRWRTDFNPTFIPADFKRFGTPNRRPSTTATNQAT